VAPTPYALYADMLDGLHALDFATVSHNHDLRYYTEAESDSRYVNVTGDTIAGTNIWVLSVENTGTGNGIDGTGQDIAVRGTASAGTGVGVRGNTPGANGYGVLGYASGSSGTGVYGLASASSGVNYGVHGKTNSPSGYAGYFEGDVKVSGNVGIGTASPTDKLDVAGHINSNESYKLDGATVLANPGTGNIFVGQGAGASNTTGNYNTFLGYRAGYSNTTGSYNTFSGNLAGFSNTTGVANTFSGNLAGYSNTTGNYNTFSGLQSGYANTTGVANTFSGYAAGFSNTTGNYNTFLGNAAGYYNTTGSGNIFIGFRAGHNETGSNKLYIANSPVDANVLIYGDFSTGRVGLGTKTLSYRLQLPNTADTSGRGLANAWVTYSSRRWKTNVEPIENALDKVEKLRGVYFDWKENGKHDIGFIAEEVGEVIPEVVGYSEDGKNAESLDYPRIVALLVEAIKEQQKKIDALESALAQNESLKQRIEALESKM